MKRIIATVVLCVFTINGADDSLAAYTQYAHGNYAQALSAYEALSSHNAAALFTMGNCAYMLEQYPQALAYWARAQRTANPSLLYRCVYNSNAVHDANEHAWVAKKYSFLSLLLYVPTLLLQIIVLVLVYTMLYVAYNSGKKKWKMVFCLALLCLLMAGSARYVYICRNAPLFVVHTQTALYAGPHDYHAHRAQIEAATVLDIYEQRDDWCKVQYAGTHGWVSASSGTVV